MTNLNRRSFVAALAASLTSASAAQAAGEQSMQEHPDLLAMSDQLTDVLQTYKDATGQVKSIDKTWGPQWPTPDPIIMRPGGFGERHADILGRGITTPERINGTPIVHRIPTPDDFEGRYDAYIREAKRTSKFKKKGRMERNLKLAEETKVKIEPSRAYWSEVERIEAESDVKAALEVEKEAREALRKLVGKILTFEEQTPIGLGIKAQALAAFIELPPFWQMANPDAPKWMAGLTATLERQVAG